MNRLTNLPDCGLSPNYQILARSATRASNRLKLQSKPTTCLLKLRAYSSPEELAADKDIDPIVVSTRVDTHYGLAKTAVNAGKNTYVEWPLGSNVDQARELVSLAKEKGVKTCRRFAGKKRPFHSQSKGDC
jgi:predicted dehydrogenase